MVKPNLHQRILPKHLNSIIHPHKNLETLIFGSKTFLPEHLDIDITDTIHDLVVNKVELIPIFELHIIYPLLGAVPSTGTLSLSGGL
jgi:hypothetical protein